MTVLANPVLPGCYPDPTVCRVGEDYYLVTSTFEYFPALPVFHSRDLGRWEQIGHVIDREGQLDLEGIASSGGLYAPTLRHHDGVFWLVCTLVDQRDEERGGTFLMTAADPAGPWSDPVWLECEGIDPSVLFDDDGRIWVHGARRAHEPEWHDQTEVWVRELDPGTLELVGPEHVIWSGAVRGAVWAEGPHIYAVGDTYYLLAAEGGTEFHHAVAVARAPAATGPYEACRSNPVLTHRHLGRDADVVGVGHADLVQAADGTWWAVLLGMRPYGGYHYPLGRETFLVPVVWEEGWPVFAPGVGRVPEVVEVGRDGAGPAHGDCSGLIGPEDLRWTTVRGPWSHFAAPEGDGWLVRLRPETLDAVSRPALLAVRQQHRDLDVRVTVRGELLDGEECGLVVRQSEDDHVRLGFGPAPGGVEVTVTHRRGGADLVLGRQVVPRGAAGQVVLALRARGRDYTLLAGASEDALDQVAVADGSTLDSVSTGGFLGLWIGVYGTSNGRPTESVVHVERFECVPVR